MSFTSGFVHSGDFTAFQTDQQTARLQRHDGESRVTGTTARMLENHISILHQPGPELTPLTDLPLPSVNTRVPEGKTFGSMLTVVKCKTIPCNGSHVYVLVPRMLKDCPASFKTDYRKVLFHKRSQDAAQQATL